MTSEEIYADLLLQYEKLSLEEKNAILIYKSQLYLFLNPMTRIPNYLEMSEEELLERLPKEKLLKEFQNLKRIVKMPKNYSIYYSVFSSIDFTDIYTCLRSLKKISILLDQARGKITLPDTLTVYRGISVEQDELSDIAFGKYLSTGLQIEDTEFFLFWNKYSHIYEIQVEKGASVLVTPYSLLMTYDKDQSPLECLLNHIPKTTFKIARRNKNFQQELVFFREELEIEEQSVKKVSIEDQGINYEATVHKVTAKVKEKEAKNMTPFPQKK